MRTRLEMRFLPILGFAEMKPQALQEDFYIEKNLIILLNSVYIFSEQIVILQRVKY